MAFQGGFTFVETLIASVVFVIIAISVSLVYSETMNAMRHSRYRTIAVALSNEQFEIMRNLSYEDVGIQGGLPSGKIPRTQVLVRDNREFSLTTTIRNKDDAFDGTIGGNPNDLSPADYKLAEVEITCPSCANFGSIGFTTIIAPKALETMSTNGALFVRTFDSSGQPVSGADVHIENNQIIPPFTIDDTTNNDGLLQVVDAPPGAGAYEIGVSKSEYSSDKTYEFGAVENPNPLLPHATVAAQELTQISFSIDRVGSFNVASVRDTCLAVSSIDYSLKGAKLIGTNPNVLKYSANHVTDAFGIETISGMEWDTYSLEFNDSLYDLAGTIPLAPIVLNAGAVQDVKIVVQPKNPKSYLVTVKDASSQLPLSDASVRLEGIGYDNILTTGRGFIRQTDWSGGGGQEDYTDPFRYISSDGNVAIDNPAGELKLIEVSEEYTASGNLVSSTFDTGSPSNFYEILWQPQSQAPETGAQSVRLQIATNNDRSTWIFLGPDGTEGSYYTTADRNINSSHNGDRYLRYKVFLSTENVSWSPIVSDVSFTFTSSCVPPGQVLFSGLSSGDYSLTVAKTGYQTSIDAISIASDSQRREIVLAP